MEDGQLESNGSELVDYTAQDLLQEQFPSIFPVVRSSRTQDVP